MKLDYSKVTPDMIRKAAACEDVEALKKLMEEEGFPADETEIKKIFETVKARVSVLSADELENISGGKKCKSWCDFNIII